MRLDRPLDKYKRRTHVSGTRVLFVAPPQYRCLSSLDRRDTCPLSVLFHELNRTGIEQSFAATTGCRIVLGTIVPSPTWNNTHTHTRTHTHTHTHASTHISNRAIFANLLFATLVSSLVKLKLLARSMSDFIKILRTKFRLSTLRKRDS